MKKATAILLLMAITSLAYTQSNIYEVNGNIGIGTAAPRAKLHVSGSTVVDGDLVSGSILNSVRSGAIGGALKLVNPAKIGNGMAKDWFMYNMSGSYGNSLQFWAYDSLGCSGGLCANRFTLMDNGNVGVGTMSPSHKLTLDLGSTRSGINIKSDGDPLAYSDLMFEMKTTSAVPTDKPIRWVLSSRKDGFFSDDNTGNTFEMYAGKKSGGYLAPLLFKSNGDVILAGAKQATNGNVGIGTRSIPPGYKLAVAGNVIATEMKIQQLNNWPDYVFKKGYPLPSLDDVEKHIKEKGHLPEVPSAKEVEKEGIALGANQAVLLKKIEELTLYIIEQEKRLNALEKRVSQPPQPAGQK